MFKRIWNFIFGDMRKYRPTIEPPVQPVTGSTVNFPLIDRLTYNVNRAWQHGAFRFPADDPAFYRIKQYLRRGLKVIDFPEGGRNKAEWRAAPYAVIQITANTGSYLQTWPSATAMITASLGNETARVLYDPRVGVVHAFR